MALPLAVLFLLSGTCYAWAESVAESVFGASSVTRSANVAALVVDVSTGQTIDAWHETHLLPTASTMKVVTTATALVLRGSDYRYTTTLYTRGKISDGVLSGDLYVCGTGDPTLASSKIAQPDLFDAWVDALRQKGIRRIDGRVIADQSLWNNFEAANPAWTWDDMANYYGMGVFPLSYMDNTVRIYLHSGAQGSIATVDSIRPEVDGMTINSLVRCTDTHDDDAYVYGQPLSAERYMLGEIPSDKGAFCVKGDMPDPGLLLVQHLTRRLREDGIAVSGEAVSNVLPVLSVAGGEAAVANPDDMSQATILYEHRSPALRDIVYETNQSSNNQYAEMLFRSLATDRPASIASSRSVIADCWKQRGVIWTHVIQKDGCGLAPQNGIAPLTFVSLLRYMYQSPQRDAFLASLPVSGQTGTGKNFLRGTPLQGKVFAKSGTIAHLRAYTGYIILDEKRVWAFSVVVNNGNGSSSAVRKMIEHYLLILTK